MTKVERIAKQIERLSLEELVELREWFQSFDAWDRQIDAEARAAKVDRLFEEALRNFRPS